MIKFLSLASGSKGNATLVYDEETVLLFDMGVSLSCLRKGLGEIHKNMGDLEAIFITHEHNDHIKGLQYIHDVTCFVSPGTLKEARLQEVGETIQIGKFEVTSFPVSHDAKNPVGYWITNDGTSFAYITDTGVLKKSLIKKIQNADYYLLESNYDPEMLANSNRSRGLKARINSKHGHLSNEQSALASLDLMGEKTKCFYLAHRSEECNSEEAILNTYASVYEEYGVALNSVKIVILQQHSMVEGGDQ